MRYPIEETLKQPNGSFVRIEVEQISGSLEDMRALGEDKIVLDAAIQVYWGYGSVHTPYQLRKRLYADENGYYTYKKQKTPFFTRKPSDIEKEYEHWTKTPEGYSIPLNEPRLIKKNVF